MYVKDSLITWESQAVDDPHADPGDVAGLVRRRHAVPELIGGHTTTFDDWYADLPPASPQTFGDQTDVPESADWWDASYLIVWGTNLPITRTPDAHFMTEVRYRGQKVVVVSPDYSDHVKFADDWVPAQPGTDRALAMAMGHVMLREFWVDRRVPRFEDYAKRFTDFEGVVTFGLGLRRKTGFRVLRLTSPKRLVVDVAHWRPSSGPRPLPRVAVRGHVGQRGVDARERLPLVLDQALGVLHEPRDVRR
ncbi:MAG TPA: molybdopterin-dependent oxidoreductase [Solirubrobacteraceae bacterium]|nr:molybdopterin-dependent oxidoreductase [Solirubrobacteraceae bacterium]